ncbi:Conserved membrane hypothetical protein (Protein of unknown function DUF165 domain protein) [Candidatus Hamiltonella defensa (Bemisia tabaci)]|nr:Conserved membrane hypothetical protein (Protein of unknown function DUF165 domain protein) [Candidatus Hamiltonella defensa (Bemisia tabaci)]
MDINYKLYGFFIGLTVTIMVVCDILVYKVYDIFGLKITASGIVFSLCYLLSTIITEVYGYKLGCKVVWIIVFCQTIFVLIINLSSIIQIDTNSISKNYHELFSDFWRVMIGTWISVPASYFCNSLVISKLKIYFFGKFFIIRYILSSMIAQGILILTAYPISLSSKYSSIELVNIITTTWTYKVFIALVLLPVGVFLSDIVKRFENTDYYDLDISYNPFLAFKEENKKIKRNMFGEKK